MYCVCRTTLHVNTVRSARFFIAEITGSHRWQDCCSNIVWFHFSRECGMATQIIILGMIQFGIRNSNLSIFFWQGFGANKLPASIFIDIDSIAVSCMSLNIEWLRLLASIRLHDIITCNHCKWCSWFSHEWMRRCLLSALCEPIFQFICVLHLHWRVFVSSICVWFRLAIRRIA